MRKIVFAVLLSVIMVSSVLYGRTSHREFRAMNLNECADCHLSSNVPPNHDEDFLKTHRLLAEKADSNCKECHGQSFCLDCHTGGGITQDLKKSISYKGNYMPKSHRSDFISIHSIKAMDNPQNCYRCHESRFCEDCHTKIGNKGTLRIKSHKPAGSSQSYIWNQEHALEARRNLQSCQSCHPDAGVCVPCHKSGGANPHPKDWKNIKERLLDRTKAAYCKKCHI